MAYPIVFAFSWGSTCTAATGTVAFVSETCLTCSVTEVTEVPAPASLLGAWYAFPWSPDSQVLVHSRTPTGTEADAVWRETRDTVMISIIFVAGGQVMLKQSICPDKG